MPSNIYTRGGDKGTTSLVDGSRRSKTSPRIEAYGTIDEANSWIGAARVFVSDRMLCDSLEFLQHRIYNCSSNTATPPGGEIEPVKVFPEDVDFLERAIDRFEETTGPLTNFVVPGGTKAASFLHVARTVTRRAERCLVALGQEEQIDAVVLKFINRASDFLFAAARYANTVERTQDVLWDKDKTPPEME